MKYMSLPQGYTAPNGVTLPPNLICHLLKSLYGLKQGSKHMIIHCLSS